MEDIEDLLLEIEQEIHDGKKPLLGSGVTVSAEVILSAVDRIRHNVPDVVREARQIVISADRKRQEDTARAQSIIQSAQAQAERMVNEHQVLLQATAEAESIRKQANEYHENVMSKLNVDAQRLLTQMEKTLIDNLELIRSAKDSFTN